MTDDCNNHGRETVRRINPSNSSCNRVMPSSTAGAVTHIISLYYCISINVSADTIVKCTSELENIIEKLKYIDIIFIYFWIAKL